MLSNSGVAFTDARKNNNNNNENGLVVVTAPLLPPWGGCYPGEDSLKMIPSSPFKCLSAPTYKMPLLDRM